MEVTNSLLATENYFKVCVPSRLNATPVIYMVATPWRFSWMHMPNVKLGRKALSNIPAVSRMTIFYDTDLKGFGLKVLPPSGRHTNGSRSWIVEYRPGAGGRTVSKKRVVLGSTETLTPERAREAARTMLAEVRLGSDPGSDRQGARAAKTIADLEPFYSCETDPRRKPRTVELYRGLWANYILPSVGNCAARSLTTSDVIRLHRRIGQDHPSTANRVVILLAHFFRWAQRDGHVPKDSNPASGIDKFKENKRERFLSSDEMARLGAAIRRAETEGIPWKAADPTKPNAKHTPKRAECRVTRITPETAAALRLLIFTGARLREILNLRWSEIDIERGLIFLADSKTGRKTIVLGSPAILILKLLRRDAIAASRKFNPRASSPVSPCVFPSADDDDRPRADLKRPWTLVTRAADLNGLRLHDLRHSFASVGAGANMGLPLIGKLLGHADVKTTARYAHLDADPLRRATNAIGAAIAEAMGE